METKKYKITEETIIVEDSILHRIEALKDFNDVKQGDKGGYIEKEDNLSQSGNCWVYHDAKVYGNAEVFDNAKVYGYAKVYGDAKVYESARVFGNARVYDNARVYGNADVYRYAEVFGNAWVYDDAMVYGNTLVCDYAEIYKNAEVYNNVIIRGTAKVYGNVYVYGNAEIYGDAIVTTDSDYIVFKNWWSSGRYFTWTKSNDMWKVGCFYGTGKELIGKAYKDSKLSGREYKRVVDYVNSILKVNEYNSIRKNIKERLLSKMRKLFGK